MKNKTITLGIIMMFIVAAPVFAGDEPMPDGTVMEHAMPTGDAVDGGMMGDVMTDDQMADDAAEGEVVNFGNKICPISGEKVGEMGEVVSVEYNGKSYNLCCAMCKKDFLKDPEKYIQKMTEQMKDAE